MPESFGHFNADTFRAAQEEPTLVIGGLLYRGRLLGIEEWFGYAEEYEALRTKDATVRDYAAFYRKYLRAVFPKSRFKVWAPDPVAHLFSLPQGVMTEAIKSFFTLQVLATQGRKDPTSGTDGTDSPPRTADAPSGPPIASPSPPPSSSDAS
jgi:hypothetical protein